jgi:preprotein translocase subunit SecD
VAPPAGTLRVGRYFLALAVLLAVLYSIVFFGSRQTPKLGIDLVGGTEVVFTAKTPNGGTPSRDSMNQARNILSERVNGTGVTEATVAIQGNDQIVVSIPGQDSKDLATLGAAAVLNFRGVVAPPVPVTCTPKSALSGGTSPTTGSSSGAAPSSAPAKASAGPSNSGAAAAVRPLGKASPTAKSPKPAASPSASPTPSGTGTATSPQAAKPQPGTCSATSVADAAKAGNFDVPLKDTDLDKLSPTNQQLLATGRNDGSSLGLANFDCASAQTEKDVPDSYYVACGDPSGSGQPYAYLLGPVIVAGKQVDTAAAIAPNAGNGQVEWTVRLTLKGSGQKSWADYTSAHNVSGNQNTTGVTSCSSSGTPCADYVAFTLDGKVLSSPVNLNAINGQDTEITGNFTSSSAKSLANQLKYGALPLSFTADTATSVSATLGTSQLKAGLLAGGIGLILVVIYSLIYYRALGLVTIASLVISGVLTYGCLVMLGTQIGFTLSLAGIAGFIVAVGITADSFVVFFERLKDEVHEGRSVRVAVPRAWVRARRTILSADTVSFLAAAVLYYFTTDQVRGFAFTLGLSTILDLIVVFLFTHPLVSLLSRSGAFGSARFTGLDALRGAAAPRDEPRPARTVRPARSEAAAQPEASSVAVLDKTEPAPEHGADEPTDADAHDPADEPGDEPRRRTVPEPGSAAERAAARRARMRQQRSDEKGER